MTVRLPTRRMATAALAAILVFTDSAFGATAPGVEEFDRSTAELTARLLLEKLQEDVLATPPDPALLEAEMNADPGKYTEPDDAKRKLQRHYRDALVVHFRQEAEKYLDRLAGDAGRETVFGPEFLDFAVALPSNRLDAVIAANYDATFTKARVNACAKQAAELIADIKPAEREFDEIPKEKLIALMTDRVAAAQRKPVFVENLTYISRNLVQPMLDAAEAQRTAQRRFLERHPVEGWTPERIRAALETGLRTFVEESAPQHREAGRVAYGVFPSVAASMPSIAEGRAIDKFARVVEETEIVVDAPAFLAAIERSPAVHRTADDSLVAFAPAMTETLVREALARCAPLVPEAERKAFDMFSKKALENDKMSRTVSNRVVRALAPQLKKIREEAARRQMDKQFPTLVSGEWFPSLTLMDFVGQAVDYRKTVLAWREMPDLADFAQRAQREALLAETSERLDGAIRDVFDRGQRARVCQHRIVDDVFEAMRTRLRAEGASDLEKAVAAYTETVGGVWAGDRDAVLWSDWNATRPSNADRQHVSLFPSTVEKIRLKVKSILESIEKEKTPATPPVEQPPETPPETPPPPPEEDLLKLECRYEVTRQGNDIVVSLFLGNERRASVTCPHEPNAYRRRYAETVGGAIAKLTEEVKRQAPKGSKVELVVDIVVRDDLVYYGIVAKLVESLNAKTSDFAESGVGMKVNEPRRE